MSSPDWVRESEFAAHPQLLSQVVVGSILPTGIEAGGRKCPRPPPQSGGGPTASVGLRLAPAERGFGGSKGVAKSPRRPSVVAPAAEPTNHAVRISRLSR